MEKRIISTQITEEDYGIENSLRPLSLDDYVGQNKVKSNLKVYIEAAKERGKDVDIVAYPFTEMERVIEGVDVALLGPQVGYQLARAKEICDPKGVPVDVIPMQDYGMCNGMNVLKFAYKLAKNK